MDLKEAEVLAVALMARHGLMKHGYTFKWDNSIRRFGVHYGRARVIGLSRRLVLLNDEEKVKNTIIHEIAHAIDHIRAGYTSRYDSSGRRLIHDSVWRNIFISIGGNGERCYSEKQGYVVPSNVKRYKWRLVHTATGKTIKKYKKKSQRYINSLFRVDGVLSGCHWEEINSGLQ